MTHRYLVPVLLALALAGLSLSPIGAQYNTKIYTEQGGEKRVYETGATLQQDSGATFNLSGDTNVKTGGTLDVQSGGVQKIESGGTLTAQTGSTTNVSGTGAIWGTTTVKLDGALTVDAGGKVTFPVILKAANYTVLARESGATFIATAADVEFTLPATAAGLRYTFIFKAPSGGTGGQVSPVAADKIMGDGFTSADDKAAINTGATDREGDSITIVADGADGWFIVNKSGTWAREG